MSLWKRRGFIVSAVLGVLSGLGLRRAAKADARPPGAKDEDDFRAKCIRCFRCAEACPVRAIRIEASWNPSEAFLPRLDPATTACTLCMRCTTACPTGALVPIPAERAAILEQVRIGVAEVDRDRCITWNRTGNCRLCWYACPFEDVAIRLTGILEGPMIIDDRCVGCGLCAEACPSQARAISIKPFHNGGSTPSRGNA